MTSNGGLAAPDFFRGKDAIVSGPAGGVVGMAETAREAGFERVIGFDMGGTSTDVARFDGTFERVYETEVAGVRLRTPMLAIHTVAAGGGSILHYDGARFRVGPGFRRRRSGTDKLSPRRPADGHRCQRHGGKVAAPLISRSIFGASGDAAARRSVGARRVRRTRARTSASAPEDVADGFIRIAVENMANAITQDLGRQGL